MNTQSIKTTEINGKTIVVRGIGKMFYESGFPIGMAINFFESKGWEVSRLHVADELLKNGWSPETTIKRLQEELIDSATGFDKDQLSKFCYSSYDDQRDMIFQALFGDVESGKSWLRKQMQA